MEKRRMARGLDALMKTTDNDHGPAQATTELPIDIIKQNPHQPRKAFDQDEQAALSASIRTVGVLQPLVVRAVGDQYQLIAGERRLRAAQDAGLSSVPVRLVDFNDQTAFEATLIENIHRADLNPIEKAQGFKEYLDRFALNHEQLAQRLGLARSTITNLVNLLELAPEVQEGLRVNQISEAHAKIIKGIKSREQQVAAFKQIVALGLSVKAAEQLVRDHKETVDPEADGQADAPPAEEKTNHVRGIEDELRQKLSTPVEIRLRGTQRGQIVLRFESNDDFLRILEVLRR